ncbi:PspC domain-containing protein [Kribbella lupini]|uniref:Phage shock protein PspC N-terminal domain-containing protein n=1 Tax=Kribbella lupini TaxID=291602 RepID=A0ABN2B1S4_9ACTN
MEQNQSGFDRTQLRDVQSWRRSRSDRMVAGVCGGMARALNIDPVLVRVVMATLVIIGPGILFYIAGWILMPDEGSDKAPVEGLLGNRVRADHPWLWPVVLGVCVFVAIAVMSSFNFGKLIPGPIVVLGLLYLFVFRKPKNGRRSHWSHQGTSLQSRPQDPTPYAPNPQTTQYVGQQAPQNGPPPPPAGTSSSATRRPQDRTVESVQPVWTEDDPLGLYVDEPPAGYAPAPTRPAEPPVKGVRGVKPAVVALTGLAIAIAWLAGSSTPTMLAIGVATLGAGMLIGGFIGRTMALLPLGILLAAGVAASTIFPSVPRDFKDVNVVSRPDQPITSTSNNYTFDAGSVHVDMTKTTFAPGAHVTIKGGVGEVVLKLPANVDVTGTLSAQAGEVIGLGGQREGGHDPKVVLNDLGADGKAGPEKVVIDAELKLGSITVERG